MFKKGGYMELDSYEINFDTLVIVPCVKKLSKVFEGNDIFLVHQSSYQIIKNSCLYYGCSYDGRREGSKFLIGSDMKLPIVIEERRNIIYFPTTSCIRDNSIWISYQNLIKYKKYNEYSKMLTEIYEFANEDEGYEKLEYTIGNQMRKVLEAYATFNYKKGIESISTTEEILNKIEDESKREYFRNFMYRLILNGDSHMEETARSYPNSTFFDHIDINEKIITAKSLLVFLYLIDDIHIKMYFSNNKQIKNIESWCEQI